MLQRSGYSAEIAGKNVSEAEANALAELAMHQVADRVYRTVLQARLKNPLNQIAKQVARVEKLARKASR